MTRHIAFLVDIESLVLELKRKDSRLLATLAEIYGEDMVEEKRSLYLSLLEKFIDIFGYEGNIVISRAPGRVNLMGRHVDYIGGPVNPIATHYEIISLVRKRNDDRVVLYNTDPKYKPFSFRISEELPERKIKDLKQWDDWTSKEHEMRLKRGEKYEWGDYIKGLIIYLQDYYRSPSGEILKRVGGIDALVHGDIPPKRGLSSSSALVVSIAIALRELFDLDIPLGEFIDRVGYSEWYRLTRGGTADHAAIILSKRGLVSHIKCLPTLPEEVSYAPFPEEYEVIVIDSGFERPDTEDAINYLRVTAAEYRIAVLLVKSRFKEYSDRIMLLRDISVENLKVGLDRIYEIIKSLPERASRKDLRRMCAEEYLEELGIIFSNHKEPPQGYKIRQRALYGLAEIERSKVFPHLLKIGDIASIFKLIKISHDGDRVAKFDKWGNRVEWNPSIFSTDERLNELIEMVKRGVLEKAQLYWQPGGYERSIEPIDYMCDMIHYHLEGCAEAQLMGAGLGGGVLCITRKDKINLLRRILEDTYYDRYGMRPQMLSVEPSYGACILCR